MEQICQGWNKSKGCRCEYRAKGKSNYCGIHEPLSPTTCSICLDDVTSKSSSKKLKCGHLFHSTCVARWLNSGNENAHCCATCRTPWRAPVEPVLPKFFYLEEPPQWIWDTMLQGPGAPRDLLEEMDPDDPPPLIFENFLADGATLCIMMTMDRWIQLAEPI